MFPEVWMTETTHEEANKNNQAKNKQKTKTKTSKGPMEQEVKDANHCCILEHPPCSWEGSPVRHWLSLQPGKMTGVWAQPTGEQGRHAAFLPYPRPVQSAILSSTVRLCSVPPALPSVRATCSAKDRSLQTTAVRAWGTLAPELHTHIQHEPGIHLSFWKAAPEAAWKKHSHHKSNNPF